MMSRRHAVVIGASLSGLLAARVLSDHVDRVTIVDRDELPSGPVTRAGVPQGRHGHGLLASGFRSLQTLFPGLRDDLLARGAVPGDIVGDFRWHQHGYDKAKFTSGLSGVLLSRPLLEETLRERVSAMPSVVTLDRVHVGGLAATGGRVTGVELQSPTRGRWTMDATLVVDASGRSSRSPEWLNALGFEPPRTDTVQVGLGYTTRTFVRRPADLEGDRGAIVGPRPPVLRRVGFALAMEGDRWMVTLAGWLGDHAPADPAGYLEFARTLARPDIYHLVRDAEPLTDATTYVFPFNQRRRYERLTRFPSGYLVMGDAICSFNPFYGQGMSVAALEALTLERCLAENTPPERLWRRFFRAISGIVDTPWAIAAGSDFAFPGVTGRKPAGTDLVNWYLDRVHKAAATDRDVCRVFFDVANLLAPASTLFRPSVVARVARECWRPAASAAPRARAAAAAPDQCGTVRSA
jgi:2-polyprenyl-6-methoxyphenol hydroxylase-like FAD-dependent oxidoreductase